MNSTSTTQITYNWEITGIGTITDSELGFVVTNIYWSYDGRLKVNEDSPEFWIQPFSGTVQLGSPDSDSFTEITQLTKQQVIDWVKEQIGQTMIDSMTAEIVKSIQSQKAAWQNNIEWHPLPWEL